MTEQELAASQAAALHQQQLAQHQLQQLGLFWQNQTQEIEELDNFKTHELPLARIKRIMKSDEDVRMISAEAPVLFAKACEIFILELTLRAWMHTEENKRRTLQRNDIAVAITKNDVFDFLIDIVPRDDIKGKHSGMLPQPTPEDMQRALMTPEIQQYYYHLAQQQALAQQATEQALSGAQPADINTLLLYQQQQQTMRYAQMMQQLQMQQQMQQQDGDQGDDSVHLHGQDSDQLQLHHQHLQSFGQQYAQQDQYGHQEDDLHQHMQHEQDQYESEHNASQDDI